MPFLEVMQCANDNAVGATSSSEVGVESRSMWLMADYGSTHLLAYPGTAAPPAGMLAAPELESGALT